jgi:very-short-patch-repair endonuclease
MSLYARNLEELIIYLSSSKGEITRHLKKNYKENIHYIIEYNKSKIIKQNGGQNKIDYLLTEDAFELLKNSYNLRNRYIVNVSDNVKQINLSMCIENQTIGFIENSFKDIFNIKRQFAIGKYRVDLYFIDYKLVVECDEYNHDDRDQIQETIREEYILSLGNKIIRYNPNGKDFDLSNVLREINTNIFKKLKQSDIKPKLISSTGKKVFKREKETNTLLATWDTIAKAAEGENMSTAKMSRCVKNKNIINDYYYSVI